MLTRTATMQHSIVQTRDHSLGPWGQVLTLTRQKSSCICTTIINMAAEIGVSLRKSVSKSMLSKSSETFNDDGQTRTGASSVHVWKRSVTALVLLVKAAFYCRWSVHWRRNFVNITQKEQEVHIDMSWLEKTHHSTPLLNVLQQESTKIILKKQDRLLTWDKTLECMYFRSLDKGGGQSFQSP